MNSYDRISCSLFLKLHWDQLNSILPHIILWAWRWGQTQPIGSWNYHKADAVLAVSGACSWSSHRSRDILIFCQFESLFIQHYWPLLPISWASNQRNKPNRYTLCCQCYRNSGNQCSELSATQHQQRRSDFLFCWWAHWTQLSLQTHSG